MRPAVLVVDRLYSRQRLGDALSGGQRQRPGTWALRRWWSRRPHPAWMGLVLRQTTVRPGDIDAVSGSGGVLALLDRAGLLTRLMKIMAILLLLSTLVFRPPPLTFLPGLGKRK